MGPAPEARDVRERKGEAGVAEHGDISVAAVLPCCRFLLTSGPQGSIVPAGSSSAASEPTLWVPGASQASSAP